MTLDKLASAIKLLKKYNLDQCDVVLMDAVGKAAGDPDAATVMRVIADSAAASRGKQQTRIKKLCAQGLLKKIEHPSGNMRFKQLEFGPEYLNLLTDLRSV